MASIDSQYQEPFTASKQLLDFLPIGIAVNIDGKFAYANPLLFKMLGFEEVDGLLGEKILDFIHPDDWALVMQRTKIVRESGRSVAVIDERLKRKDGSYFIASVSSKPFVFEQQQAVLTVIRDVTEERIQQKKDEHMQRLESLGLMASGIAHDFNNLLTVIMGNANIAKEKLGEGLCAEELSNIEETSQKAAALCEQMLAYSGKRNTVLEPVDLSGFLQKSVDLLHVSIYKNIKLRFYGATKLPSANINVSQMQQVIMNIILNGNDAIGDEKGRIEVRTGVELIDAETLDVSYYRKEPFASGHYIFLEVQDSGCGMNEETLSNIFDPFFTTKFAGRGLGMSAVLGIVYGHKGAIQVVSALKKGSCVRMLLPISEQPAQQSPMVLEDTVKPAYGTVLVVDDAASIREIAVMILERQGHKTIQAIDGLDAVEKYEANQDIIDVILLDLTMPRLDGKGALLKIKSINPEAKVLIISGYNKQSLGDSLLSDSIDFIQKPFIPDVLLMRLEKLMHS